jgi:crossover junction endodeoxyribonuclease RuvC
MRILGIDPGLQTTGFGVVDVDGARLAYVASGTIRTTEAARGDLPARLKIIFCLLYTLTLPTTSRV